MSEVLVTMLDGKELAAIMWEWQLLVMVMVVANIRSCCPHIIREAIKVYEHPQNINCKDGYRLSKAWLHLSSTHQHYQALKKAGPQSPLL
jgi:hypothetical protein